MAKLRRAGARWRLLVHDINGGQSHHVQSEADPDAEPPDLLLPDTELDEVVLGKFLHLEQQDVGRWWLDIGGVTVWVSADREGRPTEVSVYGPGDYADALPGVTYEHTWTQGA